MSKAKKLASSEAKKLASSKAKRLASSEAKRLSGSMQTSGAGEPDARAAFVEWAFDPWSERPVVAGVAALAVVAMWLILAACRFPWLMAIAQGIVVASPLVPAFVPSRCRLDEGGAARRGLLGWIRRSWADVRRID